MLLDTGPLGLITNPKRSTEAASCRTWLVGLVAADIKVFVPEIADYELRRELTRTHKTAGLVRLERLAAEYDYLPVTTPAWRLASQLWAQARQRGQPTADPKELDGDVILAAQALSFGLPLGEVVVASTNIGHIARFTEARLWQNIP